MKTNRNLILPIKREYVQKIFSGEKKFELRKTLPKKQFDKVYIYESSGRSKIVGEFSYKKLWYLPKLELWEIVKDSASVTFNEYMGYFRKYDYAAAFEIDITTEYKKA